MGNILWASQLTHLQVYVLWHFQTTSGLLNTTPGPDLNGVFLPLATSSFGRISFAVQFMIILRQLQALQRLSLKQSCQRK